MKLQLLLLILGLNYIGFITGICHYFSNMKKTYFDALKHCMKKSLCLADMNTKKAFIDLNANLNETIREDYWFGLNAYGLRTFQYISDGRQYEYIPEYSNLDSGTPCAYLKPSSPNTYVVHTASCIEKKLFVCAEYSKCMGIPIDYDYRCSIPFNDHLALGLPYNFKPEL